MSRLLVLDLKDRRPVWAMPAWVPEEVGDALGPDWTLHVIETVSDGSGDGAGQVHSEVLAALPKAEVYMGYGIPAGILEAAPRLRWVHSGAAGVYGSLTAVMRERDVLFTNSAGIHAEPIADTVLAMLLHFARGLDHAVRAQARGAWAKAPFYEGEHPPQELAGSTVGVVGFGGIGRAIHRRVAALGCRTLAVRRRPLPESIEAGDVLWGAEGLDRVLAESDYVVLSAPGTSETDGLIGAREIDRMKKNAVIVNVARGHLVDDDALAAALARGRIRGAGLDVFREEPLPADSPFWRLPNVLITPHVSAVTDRFWRREADLIVENIRRYGADEPLLNLVDKDAGY